ncbi:MAG: SMP-30/gluconolactonase/LRE family protein, partial [Acidobacteriota bacterium]
MSASTAASSPRLSLNDVQPFSDGLQRPECVLCLADGSVVTSDWRGGVTRVSATGVPSPLLADHTMALRPNGIAKLADGSYLLANLGDDGGVWRLSSDGSLRPFLVEVDGLTLPPANFVGVDHQQRVWVTVSTRQVPRSAGYRQDVADGFVVLVDGRGARIVADGLGYTNEAQVDPTGEWLYVNETFAQRLSRFPVDAKGVVGRRRTVTEFGSGTFPDGLCFDIDGGIWITSPVSNRVIRLAPDGEHQLMLEDAEAAHVAWVVAAFEAGAMGRQHLDRAAGSRLRNVTSLA